MPLLPIPTSLEFIKGLVQGERQPLEGVVGGI